MSKPPFRQSHRHNTLHFSITWFTILTIDKMQTYKFNEKWELYNKFPWNSADFLRNLYRFLFLVSAKARKPVKHLGKYQYLDTSHDTISFYSFQSIVPVS